MTAGSKRSPNYLYWYTCFTSTPFGLTCITGEGTRVCTKHYEFGLVVACGYIATLKHFQEHSPSVVGWY